jgi:hypothetical protein
MKLRQANDNCQAVAKAHHDLGELPSRMACEPQLPQNKNVLGKLKLIIAKFKIASLKTY